jgi:transposase
LPALLIDALAQASAQADPAPAAAQMTERSELSPAQMPRSGVRDDANLREVFYKDFRNRREVASYFGLTPSPWQSGGIDRLACA